MADTDKLVKVGQLDTIVDEIVDKFGETNGRLQQVNTDLKNDIKAVVDGVKYEHHETVTANTSHYYYFASPIPEGSVITIANNSNTTAFTVNSVAADGTIIETLDSSGLQPNKTKTYTLTQKSYGLRCYVSSTDWDFALTYGEKLADEIKAITMNVSEAEELLNIAKGEVNE